MSGQPGEVPAFNKFFQTGKFGKKRRQQIKKAGFNNMAEFKQQAGLNNFNPNSRVGRQPIQNRINSALTGGPTQPVQTGGGTPTPNQDPVQAQNTNTQQPANDIGSGLLQQSTDLTNQGANILNQGNAASQPLLNAGNNFIGGSAQDLAKTNALAASARGQGDNILNTLREQQQGADQDIQDLFNAQPLDTLRSNLSQLEAQNQASGRSNSRSGNEISAELQRGLIRDQAQARLGSNNQFRQAGINELNNQRSLDQNLASLFSGQGINQGQLGTTALNQGGNLVNNTNQLGANIFNQGFQNQLGTLGFLNNAALQNFNVQNQLLQKNLANIQGKKQQDKAFELAQQQLEAQQNQGGFLGGALSGLGGALLP